MIEITDAAKTQVLEYFNGKEPTPIRIFLNSGGWGGPSLAMALDEPKDSDNTYDVKGLKFVADKKFMQDAKLIKIDFTGMGFHLDSKLEMSDSGCGSCGTKGSCCSWVLCLNCKIHEKCSPVGHFLFLLPLWPPHPLVGRVTDWTSFLSVVFRYRYQINTITLEFIMERKFTLFED